MLFSNSGDDGWESATSDVELSGTSLNAPRSHDEGEWQISTECWIEPQSGRVSDSCGLPYSGCTYRQLPDAVS